MAEYVDLEKSGEDNTYVLGINKNSVGLAVVLEQIGNVQSGLEQLEIVPVTLEDVFLKLTGGELRD